MSIDMIEFRKNKWKYSTIGLMAILAIGFSFPDAFAAASLDSVSSIVKDIQAKVNSSLFGLSVINTAVDTKASQASLNALQADMNDVQTKVTGLSSADGSGFKTIKTFFGSASPTANSVQCTSDSNYMLFVSVTERGPSDGNEILGYSDTITYAYEFPFVNQASFTFSGEPDEISDVVLSNAIGTTQTTDSFGTVTLQTAPEAVASCTVG